MLVTFISAVAATAAFSGGALAQQYIPPATVGQCLRLDGFAGGAVANQGGAWVIVQSQGANRTDGAQDAFQGNKDTPNCQIKLVDGSAKQAGKTATYIQAGPMTKDECSVYNYLSSIDSKLNQAKASEANTVADGLVSKVSGLFTTGKLSTSGYNAIFPAVTELRKCTYDLVNQ